MDLRDFLQTLRKHWGLVALITLVSTGTAAAITFRAAPTYEAHAQMFVATASQSSGDDWGVALQGGTFAQQRMSTYAELVSAPSVTGPVIEALGLQTSPSALAGQISADVPVGTVLINLSVRDTEPRRAQDVANAVSQRLSVVVADLEGPERGAAPPVRISTVRPAEEPTAPVSPRTPLNLGLGVLVGLALGTGVAILRDTLDTSVRTVDDIRALTGRPALGVVPFDVQAGRRPLVHSGRTRPRGEAYRSLRTNLRFFDVDNPPRSVVLTSPTSGAGTSTSACNLAITVARGGSKVVLVEADLRRPKAADYLGVDGALGLTSVLAGHADLSAVLQPCREDRLTVLAGGPIPSDPSELLGSARMADVLGSLTDLFDLVVLDVPPLLPVTDAALVAGHCDGVVLVLRYGKTSQHQVRQAVESLAAVDARLIGGVLTMAPTKGPHVRTFGYRPRSNRPELADYRRSTLQPGVPSANGSMGRPF